MIADEQIRWKSQWRLVANSALADFSFHYRAGFAASVDYPRHEYGFQQRTPIMLKSLKVQNLLSYGPDAQELDMLDLNVFIGANGSGKSNLLEIIGLLKAAPVNLSAPIKEMGGVGDWLNLPLDGLRRPSAEALIEAVVRTPQSAENLRHTIQFAEHGRRFEVVDETIAHVVSSIAGSTPFNIYRFQRGSPVLNEFGLEITAKRQLKREEVLPELSILSQVKDPARYPELAHLSHQYSRILMLRDWVFGRYTPPRQEQKLGLPNDILADTCENLPLVLAEILPRVEDELVERLQALYPRISGVYVRPSGDRLQLGIKEGKRLIPATRLSDGTLRYLCLLTVLLHTSPPPLICIDEPELGLHPDVLPSLAELLIECSSKMQIIVTTHSDILVDALQSKPEFIVTVEAAPSGTVLRRLDAKDLDKWLEKYTLGELWTRGEIGGIR